MSKRKPILTHAARRALKAMVRAELAELTRKPPDEVINGSIESTRLWLVAHQAAVQVRDSKRSSLRKLLAASALMKGEWSARP